MNREVETVPEKLTYSAREVADMVGVDHKTIRRAMTNGEIPFVQIGRLKRIPRPAVNRMLGLEEEIGVDVG